MNNLENLKKDLQKAANKKNAALLQRYFKTGKGEYGEGDVFIGIKNFTLRNIAKKYRDLSLDDAQKLLTSKIHEYRFVTLMIIDLQYQKAKKNEKVKKQIFNFYLKNTKYINNWDLVDCTAPHIVGPYLLDKDRRILYNLAKSKLLWERRIAMMATLAFIRHHQYDDTLKMAEILLHDKYDLIHKAVGWMLREVGKRDLAIEEKFLKKHYRQMPRTMLRYAIEKFPENKRKQYLYGKIQY
jgi:3-methyladenine DNA glycosylase AlkD